MVKKIKWAGVCRAVKNMKLTEGRFIHNVFRKKCDVPLTLERTEFAVRILRIVYNLENIEEYTKEDTIKELIDILEETDAVTFIYKPTN